MTEKRFYQLCVGLPLVVPVLLAPVVFVALRHGGRVGDAVAGAGGLLVWSLAAGGVPYALLAAALLWLFRAEPAARFRRFSFSAPLVFAAFYWLWAAATLPGSDLFLSGRLLVGALFATLAVPVGYAYVGLAHALLALLRRLGVVEEPRPGQE